MPAALSSARRVSTASSAFCISSQNGSYHPTYELRILVISLRIALNAASFARETFASNGSKGTNACMLGSFAIIDGLVGEGLFYQAHPDRMLNMSF